MVSENAKTRMSLTISLYIMWKHKLLWNNGISVANWYEQTRRRHKMLIQNTVKDITIFYCVVVHDDTIL